MVGVSASQLAPEMLCAGDVIEYYSRAFVMGDPRGLRRAVVTKVDGADGVDFPIAVNTEEMIPTDMMLKRVVCRSGIRVEAGEGRWRKLRTFELTTGTFSAETRSSVLNKALQGAVAAAFEVVRDCHDDESEGIVQETPQSSVCSSPDDQRVRAENAQAASTPSAAVVAEVNSEWSSPSSTTSEAHEESFLKSSVKQIIDLVSSEDDTEIKKNAVAGQPTAVRDREAAAYVRSIPNRHARAKIRHQAKTKRVQWHVPRSRKRRHLAKCAITRSGNVLYHSKGFRAVKFAVLQKNPQVKEQLERLHVRREQLESLHVGRISFPEPTSAVAYTSDESN
ncbi:Set domain-containing hypothetical protein [Phytophthora megakarya]|uniref:Uncharacterized protein n=1 Tax=Phytophthora megakarya TaxID=4795 RepID=A0A225VH88_9STRA|nr:Set domain-containing hypothetical protein [Phytophthora megakarya]